MKGEEKKNMRAKIKEAEKMCLEKYGVHAKITFNIQGFDVGIDEPIYYKPQARMIQDIKQIIGPFCNTDIYVL
jgi:hypothetical protein